MHKTKSLQRDDSRIIIHFDYDCFYASVVENENPALKSVPLAIQQKQIVVTCNYEARRRGLRKLQLITDAKRVCPEAVIVLGEDLTRFRDASKELYNFLQQRIWSGRAERLGFDEVWLDCTDMVDYNLDLLNHNDLSHSFFCLSRDDPIIGFEYSASDVFGPTYPPNMLKSVQLTEEENRLEQRLIVGSHLARHLRHELESQKGYTSTVGIATNKILSKLVGNVNKPKSQTTIMPPYEPVGDTRTSINGFLDHHDVGKIPGVGFKISQKIRAHILGRQAEFSDGLVYGGTKESVTVLDVRSHPAMGPELLEEILSGPGAPKGIGGKVWELIHGIDDGEVGRTKRIPSQISQEDSYMKYLRTFEQVREQLHLLGERLIRRMQMDLMEADEEAGDMGESGHQRHWLAHPRTLRLSTRPRPAPGPDGVRARTFHRISRSAPMPNFVFSLTEAPSALAERLVDEALVPMFRALHHEKAGWNLSLVNVAATNMAETAADSKESEGRDIGKMFRRQDEVLKDFKVTDEPGATDSPQTYSPDMLAVQPHLADTDDNSMTAAGWDSDASETEVLEHCDVCQSAMPSFAMPAHKRYHELND
ncbi:hypothetical protein LTR10_018771 [Elasticomyces elasticus]|uniref:UmuC domain-containing protein n=1 Tax=Exophiala sideris TaxID=1016849 RepID=A0ABR0J7U2_9EURO|nr:hypothetical protein LTR10_018771 [Elasticomyces elasticus]KAK5029897.1 hypothetical protein LTS07_005621 [Exophiala sideris]KAK5031663.1 hypothetical protein LTR13_007653 [Exophiala sideris]KAK5058341.1 hypothetical protein LTR69_006746 [Exophiala sideris]KAK5180270.1 hypothetical protein LTR44_007396 [Eurotiomycetes sp. CCFEE 6388]